MVTLRRMDNGNIEYTYGKERILCLLHRIGKITS